MAEIIGRRYCIENPGRIIRLFGPGIFLGMLLGRKKSLLDRVIRYYQSRGIPMPGQVGDSYRLAARIEFRMARLYGKLAEKFRFNPLIHAFFDDLRQEEEEHGRLMLLCLYSVRLHPHLVFLPHPRRGEIREILRRIKSCEREVASLSLAEALQRTEEFERGEINAIFQNLLHQTDGEESRLFEAEMGRVEGHGETVPRRIRELKEKIREGALSMAVK